MKRYPDKPHRLNQIFQSYDAPIYFITFCTVKRAPILATEAVHIKFCMHAEKVLKHGIAFGRYVIMPDHVHCFVRLAPHLELGTTIRLLKRALSGGIMVRRPHWQPGFFDHLLRHHESYSAKWRYVLENPVREGLVTEVNDWPYRGEIVPIRFD